MKLEIFNNRKGSQYVEIKDNATDFEIMFKVWYETKKKEWVGFKINK
jgi:hypothetical protein